ncbi:MULTISPECIES: hypothetical protein [unclassified Streptomyces]|uniref:hypothetical protein n=1 Tax=unclassified Streptomyces TaxID=2593676 RepID=UPI00099E84DD|nr:MULTISPECIES: hypothetical protein [unclassified Streptomyces]
MVSRTTIGAAIGVLVIVGTMSACGPDDAGSSKNTTPTAGAAKTAGGKDDKAETKTVPGFIGMGLQSAQDSAQSAGFHSLSSHDSLGRDRMQAFDRNWKVCSQNIAAGKVVPVDTELDFGAVKLDETCPAKDRTTPAEAGGTMPDFAGKSVKAARVALDSGTSISVKDAAEDRFVLVESNWQVCTQKPAAGAKLNGQPVEFTAVKFGESCP